MVQRDALDINPSIPDEVQSEHTQWREVSQWRESFSNYREEEMKNHLARSTHQVVSREFEYVFCRLPAQDSNLQPTG